MGERKSVFRFSYFFGERGGLNVGLRERKKMQLREEGEGDLCGACEPSERIRGCTKILKNTLLA